MLGPSARSILRRCYATKPPRNPSILPSEPAKPPKVLPVAAAIARRGSTPVAVRIRRIKANRDQVKTGLTPSEEDSYGRLVNTTARNDLESPTLWAKTLHERRSRIRGLQTVDANDQSPGTINIGEGMGYGDGRVRIIGKKIYLPNFSLTFIRNRTPAGRPYNPYEASFRIPKNLTKNDLRSYLYFVYGVKTTYIRTDNYIGALKRIGRSRTQVRKRGGTYKRAVIGLVDPFYPPGMLEDLSTQEREAVKKRVWKDFFIDRREEMSEEQKLLTFKPRDALDIKKTKYVPGLATSRAKIMKKVLEKRKEREKMIKEKVDELMKQNPIRLRV